jgi:hypothetical protein
MEYLIYISSKYVIIIILLLLIIIIIINIVVVVVAVVIITMITNPFRISVVLWLVEKECYERIQLHDVILGHILAIWVQIQQFQKQFV